MKGRENSIKLGKKEYNIIKYIGSGTYSKVYLAQLFVQGKSHGQVACKIIDKNTAGTDFIQKFLPRELRIIANVSHPNIVNIYDVVSTTNSVGVFMYYCTNGDLLDYIQNNGMLSEQRAKHFFRQIVLALCYLHNKDIAHRDLKCENIFLTNKHNVKLGDFGFARICSTESPGNHLSRTFCGSAAYAAPEILEGIAYNPKMYDIWSIGCILYIMITSRMPFDDTNIKKMLYCQRNGHIYYSIQSLKVTNSLKELLIHLLEPTVTRRPNILNVKKCQWLKPRKVK